MFTGTLPRITLTDDETRDLLARSSAGDVEARHRLVLSQAERILSTARDIIEETLFPDLLDEYDGSDQEDELFSVAYLGLFDYLGGFVLQEGLSPLWTFLSFAGTTIEGVIRNYLSREHRYLLLGPLAEDAGCYRDDEEIEDIEVLPHLPIREALRFSESATQLQELIDAEGLARIRAKLTDRQWQVAQLAMDGHTQEEIGKKLGIARQVVGRHLGLIETKLRKIQKV